MNKREDTSVNMNTPTAKKGWAAKSKAAKRATKVVYAGRTIRALDWIDAIAKKMPKMVNKTNGDKPINHVLEMRKLFMAEGVGAVNTYIRVVDEIKSEEAAAIERMSKLNEEKKENAG